MSVKKVWFVYCDECYGRPREASWTRASSIEHAIYHGYTKNVNSETRKIEWLCASCTSQRLDKRENERENADRLKNLQKLAALSRNNPAVGK